MMWVWTTHPLSSRTMQAELYCLWESNQNLPESSEEISFNHNNVTLLMSLTLASSWNAQPMVSRTRQVKAAGDFCILNSILHSSVPQKAIFDAVSQMWRLFSAFSPQYNIRNTMIFVRWIQTTATSLRRAYIFLKKHTRTKQMKATRNYFILNQY